MSDNQKALVLFSVFFIFMGCAGQGDYEYAKSREVVTHERMCK